MGSPGRLEEIVRALLLGAPRSSSLQPLVFLLGVAFRGGALLAQAQDFVPRRGWLVAVDTFVAHAAPGMGLGTHHPVPRGVPEVLEIGFALKVLAGLNFWLAGFAECHFHVPLYRGPITEEITKISYRSRFYTHFSQQN
jgi:hypothetical protein